MVFLRRILLICLVSITPLGVSSLSATGKPDYKGAIVVDAQSGKVLFEDHADVVAPPASMTKLMTFLVVHDQIKKGVLSPQTPVPVNAASSKIGGTQVWLKQGESFPVEEMLYALLIQSANDCAHALATLVGGTPEAFVEMMNARARQLGMTHTTFRSPHGLPPANRKTADGDLSTPRDMALLSRHLVLHTDIIKYSSVEVRDFRTTAAIGKGRIVMRNHNHLLGKVAGVDGLKTGYTHGAGFCLAATAFRNGRRVITVTMGSPSSKIRDLKIAELLAKGFASLPANSSPLSVAPIPAAPSEKSPIELAPPAQPEPQKNETEEPPPVIKFSIPDL